MTSREPLHLKAEQVITLGGLPVPDGPLEQEGDAEAVRLFCERAQAAAQDFALSRDNWGDVQRICARVGGVPLGLELAASWVGTVPLPDLARQLEQDLPHLATPLRDVRPRHQSVEAAIDHSWTLLEPPLKEGLLRLSVFEGGFGADMAREVAGIDRAALERLVGKAFLGHVPPARFHFQPMVREVIRAHLGQDPALLLRARERHAAAFVDALSDLNRRTSGAVTGPLLTFLHREEANLLAALRTLRELGQLAEPLLCHFPLHSRFRAGLALCEEMLAACPDTAPGRQARASYLTGAAWLSQFLGDGPRSLDLAAQAVALARGTQDDLLLLRALDVCAQGCSRAGRLEEAQRLQAEAEEVARRLGNPTRLMRALNTHALTLTFLGQTEAARRGLEEASALLDSGAVPAGMDTIWLHSARSVAFLMNAQPLEACAAAQEGLRMAAALGSPGQEPMLLTLHDFALLEARLGGEAQVDPGRPVGTPARPPRVGTGRRPPLHRPPRRPQTRGL